MFSSTKCLDIEFTQWTNRVAIAKREPFLVFSIFI